MRCGLMACYVTAYGECLLVYQLELSFSCLDLANQELGANASRQYFIHSL